MATIDDDIDALYRLPAHAFTAARNELAKRAGPRAGEIRKLVKPTAPAWAVNQLFWRRRPVFDALAKASEARRLAHVRQLGGQPIDLAIVDARHRSALDAAFEAAVAFLKEDGDAASPATLGALERTLEAVPAPEIAGRLERAIDPVGFTGLAALLAGTSAQGRPRADVVAMKPKAAQQFRQRADAQRREQPGLKKALAAAQLKERESARAVAAAEQSVVRAAKRVAAVEAQLDQARSKLTSCREEVDRARAAANAAAAARVTLERELEEHF